MGEYSHDLTKLLTPVGDYDPGHQLPSRPFVVQQQRQTPHSSNTSQTADRIQQIDAGVVQALNLQAKLAIGAPGDKYEQEADQVAAQVVEQINAPQTQQKSIQRQEAPEDEELHMKPLADSIQRQEMPEDKELQMKPLVQRRSDGSGDVSAAMESSFDSARGQRQPLGNDVRGLEQAFGADFSGVRVYTGSKFDQLNQSIQAKAFTTGQDIFSRQGEYQLKNRGGQELLAHELTNVVQQGGSNTTQLSLQSINRQVAGSSVSVSQSTDFQLQRDVVETYGGEFETITYEDASSVDATGFIDGPSADIEIEFVANELVDCPKFGMTQTANTVIDGTPFFLRPEIGDRSLPTGEHIDRMGGRENPMYGVNNQPAGKPDHNLGGGANAGNSRWGHRTILPNGTVDEAEAYLYDGPSMSRAITDPATGQGQVVRQEFETTVLCVEGELSGTYLGSVRWGYEVDADNNFNLFPFSIISMGAPTQEFMEAAQLWNNATVDMGGGTSRDTIDLPTTAHQTVDPASLTDEQLFERIRVLADEIMAMSRDERQTRTPDYQNKRFEARGLAREASKRGAVAVDSGHTYAVQSGDNLWNIAENTLGRGTRWTQIFALNVIDILDPNLIHPGQELKMPEPYAG